MSKKLSQSRSRSVRRELSTEARKSSTPGKVNHGPAPGTEDYREKALLDASNIISAPIINLRSIVPNEPKNALQSMRAVIATSIDNPGHDPIIDELAMLYSYTSAKLLPDYATLDVIHVACVRDVVARIEDYLNDPSLTKPLNFLLLASPGSGKSQLIESIAKYLANERKQPVKDVIFNMATMQKSKDDLGRALDDARDAKVDGKLPLVFLDEFDSDESYYPLLLPLLWDGRLDVGRRELKLGRSVFFLAGSRDTLPGKLAQARDISAHRQNQSDDNKLVDLFSRINGTVITVPALLDDNRGPDKAVIAMTMLRRRFKSCRRIPSALISFIAKATFRYEARSIGTLVNLIPLPTGKRADELDEIRLADLDRFPLEEPELLQSSPLAFHLVDKGDVWKVCERWKQAKENQTMYWLSTESGLAEWADLQANYGRLVGKAGLSPPQ